MRNPVCPRVSVCMGGARLLHTDNACLMSVRALYCILNSAQFRLQVSLGASKVIAGWCYSDQTWCTLPSTYLLSDSQHSLQLRHSYS